MLGQLGLVRLFMQTIEVDIAIVGGGIAGLWTLNRLRQAGYQAILLEERSLGNGQTVHAQGIIHGGVKYALGGQLTASARAVNAMPSLWHDCLQGQGEIDLSAVKVLSPYQYLWSNGQLAAKVRQFFAAKLLNSYAEAVQLADYPDIFQQTPMNRQVYRVAETVLDVPALLAALAESCRDDLIKIDPDTCRLMQGGAAQYLNAQIAGQNIKVQATRYIFTAGAGNESLLKCCPKPPLMQCRPLRMTMVKSARLSALYGHCLANSSTPRLTITTHWAADGEMVWYLGSELAEAGAKCDQATHLQFAQQELKQLFPGLDLSNARWESFMIDRAEARQKNGARPDSVFVQPCAANVIVAWPSKLALTPLLAQGILQQLQQDAVAPSASVVSREQLPKPDIATPRWASL